MVCKVLIIIAVSYLFHDDLYGQWLPIGGSENVQPNPIYVNGTSSTGIFFGKGSNFDNNSIAIGQNVLSNNAGSIGSNNIGVGVSALRLLRNSFGNTAIGISSMEYIDTGYRNTALGYWALKFKNSITDGYRGGTYNVAIGYTAMASSYIKNGIQSTNGSNIAIGSEVLFNNNGDNNIGIGTHSLKSNTVGNTNIAIGFQSMEYPINSNSNICLGNQTLKQAENAMGNIAIGNGPMNIAVNSSTNIAIGGNSLYRTSGYNNIGIGSNSLFYLTSGTNNIAIGNGTDVGTSPTSASNTLNIQKVIYGSGMSDPVNEKVSIGGWPGAVSAGSVYPNQTPKLDIKGTLRIGTVNTGTNPTNQYLFVDADGMVAKSSLSFVSSNCTSQYFVPVVGTSGSTNLVCSQIYDNGTSVGIGTTGTFAYTFPGGLSGPVAPGSGTLRLKINGVSEAYAYYATSDKRLKKDIKKIDNPLSKLKTISGYTYYWNEDINKEFAFDKSRQAGFLAQEIEKVLPEAVIIKKDGTYSLNYNAVMPLLTEGIKAQQGEIEELRNQNELLQKQINELRLLITGTMPEKNITSASFQVVPNPVNGTSAIIYNFNTKLDAAKLIVTDLQGKIIKQFLLRNSSGRIEFTKSGFIAGMYIFSLLNGVNEIQSIKVLVN